MQKSIKFESLSFDMSKTWLMAGLFVAGNLVLPQLAHFVPQGGPMLLPIYFFTLIAAYKYGWKTGVLTAVFSPVINHLLFGMPMLAMMPVILIKSLLLAGAAAYAAHYFKKVNLLILAGVVLAYQIPGTLIEWLLTGSLSMALQDFRIGLPGMALQVLGGWALLRSSKR
jgi:hypothetical protein